LDEALAHIHRAECELLVVSLGVDIFEGDPISAFTFQHADFIALGQRLAEAGLPCVFLMEGGYAVADIGVNVVNVLQGFNAFNVGSGAWQFTAVFRHMKWSVG
jgi:acetoin utilization deacetylase AcuC-like enzyme